ncbi:MAG: inorganic phosphate transporter, partial [Deltaproteobacteria bacterium]|nr:inorganic phosphate transporter [Deltaproteobacteria bacterium]
MLSPIGGFGAALVSMIGVTWAVRRIPPTRINVISRRFQLVSSGFMTLSHGTNDAQKSMGVITMALLSYHGTETVGRQAPCSRRCRGASPAHPVGVGAHHPRIGALQRGRPRVDAARRHLSAVTPSRRAAYTLPPEARPMRYSPLLLLLACNIDNDLGADNE